MKPMARLGWLLIGLLLIVAGHGVDARQAVAQQDPQGEFDWRQDWELAEGFTLEIDSQDYNLPSAIVFVPNPGPEPGAPLYFVTELKGKVKVVTNDRTVHTFAEDFIPNPQGESFLAFGAAGICLDAKRGYVFVTFAFLDDTSVYRNGIARFSAQPVIFGHTAQATTLFLDLFKDEVSASSHQIGPCQVKDDLLYVTVGYGDDRSQSQNLHTTLGSVIRMTTDFKPVAENPFYEDDGNDTAIDYIWAYGFRNPFGLRFVGDRLFVTENGGSIDRFNEIEQGENYLWDGTDWSIGARAVQVFAPSLGLVNLDYLAESNDLFPERFRGQFFVASAGAPGGGGPGAKGRRSVLMLDYNFAERRMNRAPQLLLRFRGEGLQLPVSVAVGPDALYFVPLMPNRVGMSAVLRVRHDPAAVYPHRLGGTQSPQGLINQYRCRQCHKIGGQGGKAGPPLDNTLVPRLSERLNAPEYATRVAAVDQLESEPFAKYRQARQAIVAASGPERVRLWLETYLQEPSFDNPEVGMENVGVTEAHAERLAEYLIKSTTREPEQLGFLDRIRFAVARAIPELRYRHLAYSFVLGGVVAMVFLAGLYAIVRRRAGHR